jgi:hypothetical protein
VLFQARKPQPVPLVRAGLQNLVVCDMRVLRTLSFRRLIDSDLAVVCMPDSPLLDRALVEPEGDYDFDDTDEDGVYGLPSRGSGGDNTLGSNASLRASRSRIVLRLEQFRKAASQRWLDLATALIQNRSRLRRLLCKMLPAWDKLWRQSTRVDAEFVELQWALVELSSGGGGGGATTSQRRHLPPPGLADWARSYHLLVAQMFLQMGFELELYEAHEMAGMYAFVARIAAARGALAQKIQAGVLGGDKDGHANNQEPSSPTDPQQLDRFLAHTRLTTLEARATHALADALVLAYAALDRARLLGNQSRAVPATIPALSTVIFSATGEMIIVPPKVATEPYMAHPPDALKYRTRLRPFFVAPDGDDEVLCLGHGEFEDLWRRDGVSVAELLVSAAESIARAREALAELVGLPPDEAAVVSACAGAWTEELGKLGRSADAVEEAVAAVREAVVERDEKRLDGVKVRAQTPREAAHEWWLVPKFVPKEERRGGK